MANQTIWKKHGRDTLDCLECERTVKRSREDQKFCSDGCRYAYNRRASYRDHTVRMSFAEWHSFIAPESDPKQLTKPEFMARIRAQLEKVPSWT